MSDTRADVTSMGLYLISFIMLVFGLIGVFAFSESDNVAGLSSASTVIAAMGALLFLFLGYASYKNGSKFVMIIFFSLALFVGLYAFAVTFNGMTGGYLVFVAIAIFLIIYALVAFLSKSGYMLTLLLVCAAMVFLFFALATNDAMGTGDGKTFMLVMGIFAFLSFILSLWLALADTTDVGLPVV